MRPFSRGAGRVAQPKRAPLRVAAKRLRVQCPPSSSTTTRRRWAGCRSTACRSCGPRCSSTRAAPPPSGRSAGRSTSSSASAGPVGSTCGSASASRRSGEEEGRYFAEGTGWQLAPPQRLSGAEFDAFRLACASFIGFQNIDASPYLPTLEALARRYHRETFDAEVVRFCDDLVIADARERRRAFRARVRASAHGGRCPRAGRLRGGVASGHRVHCRGRGVPEGGIAVVPSSGSAQKLTTSVVNSEPEESFPVPSRTPRHYAKAGDAPATPSPYRRTAGTTASGMRDTCHVT